MRLVLAGVIGAGAIALVTPLPASGAVEVGANGNFFIPGSLSFTPKVVTVPHTATERHRLWDLGGTYGGTPFNDPGFAPGETVERRFEAGTHQYYCRVHPADMTGTVNVAPSLAIARRRVRVRRRGRRRTKVIRYVVARWAVAPPGSGLVFDVERRRGTGPWRRLRTGATVTTGRFRAGARGTTWQVRARLRRAARPSEATDFSPPATIRS